MRAVWVMVTKDLQQRLRDKSVLIFSIAVPLALMSVLNLVIPTGADEVELEPVSVAVAVDPDDELAGVVVSSLTGLSIFPVTATDAEDPRARVDAGDADLGLIIPPGLTEDLRSGTEHSVQMVVGDNAGLSANILIAVTDGLLAEMRSRSVSAAAEIEAGLAPEVAAQLAQEELDAAGAITAEPGEASDQQLSAGGALIAGQAGLFLMFTVGFGVLSMVAERDNGTLARLRSMPIRPGSIVLAKALGAFVLGVLATSVLLIAGSLLFGVTFGNLGAVAVLVVCAVAAATSLTFIVVRLARTAEQANIVQTILALVLGMSGGAFFPIAASGALGAALDVNPIAAFTRGLGITAGGGGLTDLTIPVLTLLAFAAACLLISRLIPDRGETR
ncbi:ABC transporter permease [Ruania alba]|uniref:ABC-2 type transport system permease protein n=1 Tax=Ruania alba TaxID=648782 RepID=A0A1H5CZX3_9MICO|nr:ABC transporter permease [Ruania alba]SED72008.1 ABC-2 type transport system permease protein [Ruania alba]